MNKIYRRLWSTARQCWVVASELTAARGKASHTLRAGSLLTASLLLAPSAFANSDEQESARSETLTAAQSSALILQALGLAQTNPTITSTATRSIGVNSIQRQAAIVSDPSYADSTISGDHLLVLGSRSTLSGAQSVAYGNRITSRGTNNTALGYNVQITNGGYATGIGAEAVASGVGTTALGNNAKAYTENSIAVGSGSKTNDGAGISRIAIGGDAYAGTGGYTGAIALGGLANASHDSVAIGYQASTTSNQSVALGRGSVANESYTVSVGKAGATRRIVNVKDGRLASGSSDAVTGHQLFATNTEVGKAKTAAASAQTTANTANTTANTAKTTATAATTTANSAKTAADTATARLNAAALALGSGASAEGSGTSASTALGSAAKAYNTNNVAFGADARSGVDANGNKSAGATGAVALGAGSRGGNGAVASGLRAIATGDRAVAIGNDAQAKATHATALGYKAAASANQSTAVGRETVASGTYASAVGNLAKATAEGSVAVGSSAVATHASSVALGSGAVTTASNQISVGNGTTRRTITHVADGALSATSTDAVTGKQLNTTNLDVAAVRTTANAAQTAAAGARTTADSALNKANTLGGLVSQVSASGNVRLGGDNTGTVLDVRNKSNANRKLTGLGDGTLSATSTEAVTGKQLNATNTSVTTAQNTATAAQTAAAGAKTTADSALGKANALGGLVSQVSATGNVRLGGDNTGTLVDVANKSGANRRITGLGDGTLSSTSTEAVTGKQLNATNTNVTTAQNTATAAQTAAAGAKTTADSALGKANALGGLVSQVSATGNVRLGGDNTGTVLDVANKSGANRRITGLSDGALSSTSTEAVTGKQLNATNTNVTTAQNTATAAQTAAAGAKTTADSALGKANALGGLVSQVSATGNVRLGGDNTGTVVDVANKSGAKRRVNNVANGTISSTSTDVVTGQQLHATNQSVSTQGQSLVLHGQQLAAHTQSLAAQDVRVSANRSDIDKLRADVDNFDPDLDGVVKFASDGSVDVGGGVVRNVAAGDISSAASTDAVNGGQLFAANVRIAKIEATNRLIRISSDKYSEVAEAGAFGVAIGDGAKASLIQEGGTAIGSFTSAFGKNSVALGRGSNVDSGAENGFALGVGANVYADDGMAFGPYSRVEASATSSVAIGSSSIADESDTVSLGSSTFTRRMVNVSRGTSDHNATTVAQLKDGLATLGGGAGMDASGNVTSPTYAVQGSTQRTVGDALAALDGAVVAGESRVDRVEDKLRSVFQDNKTLLADGLNQITLAGANGAVLTNLADGRIAAGSRDAVTGSQLYAAKQDIARNRNDIEQMKESGGAPASQSRMVVLGADRNIVDFGGSRLSGVQAGDITSTTSTDAVNGGQLFATNAAVIALEESSKFMTVGGAGDQEAARAGLVGVALGDSARASLDSEGGVAVGSYASALGKNSVALGRAAYVSETSDRGFALGVNSSVEDAEGVALGAASAVKAGAINAVAVGANSIATESATVSFGNGGLARRLVYVARGTSDDNATNVGQLKDSLATLGGGAGVDGNGNVVAPTYAIQGSMHRNVVDALAALDGAVVTTGSRMDRVEGQLRSVFQESPSARADGLAHLTFAGANGMVLSNVGNGLIAAGSRDAVNGGQLHNMQQQLNGRMDGLEQRMDGQPQALQSRALTVATAGTDTVSGTPAATPAADEAAVPPPASSDNNTVADVGNAPKSSPQPKAESPKAESPTPQVDTAELEKMLARANEYTDGAIKGVEQRLDKMDKRFNRMAAMSSAQTAMAMNTAGLATYNRLGAGVGYAEGESAMAVGYQRVLNEKGSATFSLNGAFTNSGEQSVGLGVGIGW